MNPHIPHLRVVISVSAFVLAGFAAVSVFVLGWTGDEVTKGNVIGTWVNFAMLAVGFWLGSSSGGKAAANAETPTPVTVANTSTNPVPTTDSPPALPDPEPKEPTP